MTLMVLVLSVMLQAAAGSDRPAASTQAGSSSTVAPGQPGHVLKMTREMVELAKSHDPDRRTNLFLRYARERLKEREALGTAGGSSRLGEAYDRLVDRGAAGAIECGAAEGRDMDGAVFRYSDSTRRHHDRWSGVVTRAPAEDRHFDEVALETSAHGFERAREAQKTGQLFAVEEWMKEKALERERERLRKPETPAPPRPAAPPEEKPAPPLPPTADAPKRPPAGPPASDPNAKGPDKETPAPPPTDPEARPREHHNHQPHHPHR